MTTETPKTVRATHALSLEMTTPDGVKRTFSLSLFEGGIWRVQTHTVHPGLDEPIENKLFMHTDGMALLLSMLAQADRIHDFPVPADDEVEL